jgi:hypothetical protein
MRGLPCVLDQATTNDPYGVRYSATQLEEPQFASSFRSLAKQQETVQQKIRPALTWAACVLAVPTLR